MPRDSEASARVSISAICASLGITPRAVRYYEEIGLVEAGRNASNRRCYDNIARDRLALIVLLRRADISVPEIRGVLSGTQRDIAARAATALRRRLDRLNAQIPAVRGLLDDLESLRCASD